MNGTYYKNPTFPSVDDNEEEKNDVINIEVNDRDNFPEPGIDYLPTEQSYIENILRLNKGSNASVYVTFPDSSNWRDKIFVGTIEQAGRDHLIIKSSENKCTLIPMIYLNYVEFNNDIIYRPIDLQNKKN